MWATVAPNPRLKPQMSDIIVNLKIWVYIFGKHDIIYSTTWHLEVRWLSKRKEELVEKMRCNPRNWRFEEVESLLQFYGFTMRRPKRGSHRIFTHPDLPNLLNVPHAKPVKPVYVRKVVEFLDELSEKRGGEE